MAKNKTTQLLKVAVAAHKRGETSISQDLWVLAMEEGDMDSYMDYMDDMEDAEESEEDLKQELEEAMENGDYEAADACLQKLRSMSKYMEGDEAPADDASEEPELEMDMSDMDLDLEGDEDDAEAKAEGDEDDSEDSDDDSEDSDDDFYDDSEGSEDPLASFSAAQVKTFVSIASKIKRAGHKDLAAKITRKLGL